MRCNLARSVLLVALAAATGAWNPSGARAQSGRETADHYETTIQSAVAEYRAGRYAEARALFLEAHALRPSARTCRGLGIVEFELAHYARATELLREALADTRNALDADQRGEVEHLLERSLRFVGEYRVQLVPAAAILLVDGNTVDPTHPLLLDVGDHTLEASAPGHSRLSRKLDVRGGERQTLELTLVPDSSPAPRLTVTAKTLATPAPTERGDGGVLGQWWFWTAAGVVVAGVAAGIAVAASGDEKQHPLKGSGPGLSAQALRAR